MEPNLVSEQDLFPVSSEELRKKEVRDVKNWNHRFCQIKSFSINRTKRTEVYVKFRFFKAETQTRDSLKKLEPDNIRVAPIEVYGFGVL